MYAWVKKHDAEQGLTWLKPLPFNKTYTIMMQQQKADPLGIRSLSDLKKVIPGDFPIRVGAEFYERPHGIKKMAEVYGMDMDRRKNVRKMDDGLTYKALKERFPGHRGRPIRRVALLFSERNRPKQSESGPPG